MLHLWFSLSVASQKTISNEEIALISYVIFITLILVVTFVMFFVMFQKRKNQLIRDKIKQQQQFDKEIILTQQEIQEETLRHVGRELHDNIGQMLVMSTMQMNAAANIVTDTAKIKVTNAAETLKSTLDEVRALSKSLNSDVIFNLGFDTTVENEIKRLNKTGLINSTVTIYGEKVNFENKKDEIILFRILQEFSSNTLKYAEANHLNITIDYAQDSLNIIAEDDGNGFDLAAVEKGSGLINMEKRAELIQAKFNLESQIAKGTTLNLNYPYKFI
ncbi:MAG: sensor histidine kinase [Winogradskyella sp.]|uniref:sensor histidine kinase n=1 Tax=Winogradskyella sp. TaxID=1883156 RepID=UPI00385F69F1